MPPIHPGNPLNVGYLMLDGAMAMTDEILRELHAQGFDDLRPAHIRLAQHFDENGSRITDLAKRAQLTKQTVVHTINDLERLGYAYRTPDPADARAKLVLMTKRGRQSIRAGEQIATRIEQRWAAQIGKHKLQTLRELLLGLTNTPDKDSYLSPRPARRRRSSGPRPTRHSATAENGVRR